MRRRIPSALLLTALAATSVAAVAPTGPEDPPAGSSPAPSAYQGVGLAQMERGAVLDLVSDGLSGSPEDRAFVALALLQAMPEFDALTARDASTSQSIAPVVMGGSDAGARVVGDLDGDGLDDVVEYALEWDGQETTGELTARRGTDGAPLWSRSAGGSWYVPFSTDDVDGDGRADLVEVTIDWDWDCEPCEFGADRRETMTLEQRWEFVSGATGRTLGVVDHLGSVTIEEARSESNDITSSEDTYRYENRTEGWPVLVRPVGDQDGDGAVDLLVSELDLSDAYEESYRTELVIHDEQRWRYELTGEPRATVRTVGGRVLEQLDLPAGSSWVMPLGAPRDEPSPFLVHTIGDAAYGETCAGTLVLSSGCETTVEEPVIHLGVIEGGTFDRRWQLDSETHRSLDDVRSAYPLGADVEGDGSFDIVADRHVRSGADGLIDDGLAYNDIVQAIGVDGRGRPVLLGVHELVREVECEDGRWSWELELWVDRVTADGLTIGSSKHDSGPACDNGAELILDVGGDHDADGIADVYVTRWTSGRDYATEIEAVTGDVLLPWTPGLAVDVRDADGDEISDVLIFAGYYGQSQLFSVARGETIRAFSDDEALAGWGQLHGDPVTEVLIGRDRYEDRTEDSVVRVSWTEMQRAQDGDVLWRTPERRQRLTWATTTETSP